VTLQIGPVEIAEVVKEAVEQVAAQIEAKGHHLQINLPSAPVLVSGDRSRIIQIIVNLLSNATKYSPSAGRIDIQVTVEKGWVNLCIRDWGIGIDSAFLPRIFNLFSQGTRSSDRSQGGLGLGLALVKRLVELHGGSVTAHSNGDGRGSHFIVRLHRLEVTQNEAALAVDSADLTTISKTATRVVIVDDNEDAANLLALFLTEAGHHDVRTYYDGQDALDNMENDQAVVYILDIGLPDMDGYELARRLRESSVASRAKLIALTGYGQEQDRAEAMTAGFDYHLSKPANLTDILELISKIIADAA
jgi:CheY-like chemotaxis protein/anti-sigma regulatory factor (Ser/Thr protein kinase)